MLPTINEFISKYGLENFVVVADTGLMNNANIAELEAHGYKYIIGAKIKIAMATNLTEDEVEKA